MGKGSAPDSPDPQALIKAQTDANRVNQYTPYGNLQYGKFDEYGNLIPNSERESVVQTQRPQDQTFQNYTDAGRAALYQSIFGGFTPAASSSATGTNSTPTGTGATGSSLAQTMAKPVTNAKEWTYDQLFGAGGVPKVKGANFLWEQQQANAAKAPEATTTSAAPNPYGSNTQGGGIGSFSGFNLAGAGDPNITKNLSGWGDPNSLKKGLTEFYNLSGIQGDLPSVSTDFSGDRKRVEDAVYNRSKGLLDQQFAERNNKLRQQLADQGLVLGSEAYNGEMDRLNRAENEGYTNAAYDAVRAGGDEYQRLADLGLRTRGQLFGEDTSLAQLTAAQRGQQFGENQGVFNAQNQLRQMQLQEALSQFNANNAARSNQLGEASSLLGMQSPQANFVNSQPIDAAGIMQQDYANRMNAYNSSMGGLGSLLGVGGSILGGGLNPGWLSAMLV